MKKNDYLKIILLFSFFGMLFSGYLSYGELFGSSGGTCGITSSLIFGLPSCVYGFLMYVIIGILAFLGLKSE